MDYSAIFHRPMSEYAHAIDETHYCFRIRGAKDDIKSCVFYFADRASMEPKLTFESKEMLLVRSDKYYDYYEILLETQFIRIAYYFEINDGHETIYYLGDCFEKDPDQGRADFFQLPFNHRGDRVSPPKWVEESIVYNIFPDSFATNKGKLSNVSRECIYNGTECKSLHGGTIKGIEENLEYIKNLGFNCIYLNPIAVANSYHKYDIVDYYHVDPTRGTDDDFRQLVRTAHGMGMRVIVDGVFNHISWQHPIFQDVLDKGKESKYFDWFYDLPDKPCMPQNGLEPEFICFAYVPEMPKTNTANPLVRDYFCDVGTHWIKEFDVDGWRLDVANETDDVFLRAFNEAVKKEKSEALVIGEVWENASHYINAKMMDSAMNYDFRRFCDQFFAKKAIDAAEFDSRVTGMLMRYPHQSVPAQLNLLDSHDVSRFLSLCNEDIEKMELAILFQMTFVGMPSVFYGDEKGLSGVAENEYRRPMEFDKISPLEDIYKKMISLRSEYKPLRCGEYRTTFTDEYAYGYERIYNGQSIRVLINANDRDVSYNLSGDEQVILQKHFDNCSLGKNGYVVTLTE